MSRSYYKHGDHNAICDQCGFQYKFSELKKRWDNKYVCEADWEMRHPMDLFKDKGKESVLDVTRPEKTPKFVGEPLTYPPTIADIEK